MIKRFKGKIDEEDFNNKNNKNNEKNQVEMNK